MLTRFSVRLLVSSNIARRIRETRMGTDFSVLRQYLHSAWLQAQGTDQTMVRVRKVLGELLSELQRAEDGCPTFSFGFFRQLSTPPQTYNIIATKWGFKGELVGNRPFEP
jgi:hypothetical protein